MISESNKGPFYGAVDVSYERFEARKWLGNNGNVFPLANNRFRQGKGEALAFVEDLYVMGAKQVLVTNIRADQWRLDKEGGPYADTIVVILPRETEKRARLFAAYNSIHPEHSDIKCAPEDDTGQFELIFWWD